MSIPAIVTTRTWKQHRIHTAVACGDLVPVLPGVCLRQDLVHDLRWRAAAVPRWNSNAVVCGESAASLTFWPELVPSVVDVAASTNISRPGYRFSRRAVPSGLCRYRGDARITAPALTAIDLSVPTDGAAIDRALRSRSVRIGDLRDALAATAGRRGNARRAQLLLDSRAEPWSVPERMAHKLLRRRRIDGWRANAPVVARGHAYFVDIAFLGCRLAIEIDGREFHIDAEVFETDRQRQNDLVLSGWTVLRFTYRRLVDDQSGVLAEIRDGLVLAGTRR